MGSEIFRTTTILLFAIVGTCIVEDVPLFSGEGADSLGLTDFEILPYTSKTFTKTKIKPVAMPFGLPSIFGISSKPVTSKPVIFEDDLRYRNYHKDIVKGTVQFKNIAGYLKPRKATEGLVYPVFGERFLAKAVNIHNCPSDHTFSKLAKRCVRKYVLQDSATIG